MKDEKRFLADVGIKNLPLPVRVTSKAHPEGVLTIADISIHARIMHEFEPQWIDTFIQIAHRHRENIGATTLRANIREYLKQLKASVVRIDFDYPYFIEKHTPVSKEPCLVKYSCTFAARISLVQDPKITFKIGVPAITTFPASYLWPEQHPFAQLSILTIKVESAKDVFPEDIVDIVDRHALSPVYSFLTVEDQAFIIKKAHTEKMSSVALVDDVREELSRMRGLTYFSVQCSNYGMLHPYITVLGTEKSIWIPYTETDIDAAELL
jgi:GTP cyclohydrolase IB